VTRGFLLSKGTKQMSEVITQSNAADDLAGDLIWELKPIAQEIGVTERQAYHLIYTRQLPVRKIGGRFCASRSGLRRFFADLMAGKVA
jgi:hypothetical protein